MITTNRNITLTCHVTKETKEAFRSEAERRKMGMSELLSNLIEDWLVEAPQEQVEEKRSNKRVTYEDGPGGKKISITKMIQHLACPNDPYKGMRADIPCMCDTCIAIRREEEVPLPFGE